jgi:flavodoxin
MKRKTMAMAAASTLFAAFGCTAADENIKKVTVKPGKILVAYFSYSGNTRYAAEQIKKNTGGTLFEIKPVKAYPADYSTCVAQARKECGSGFKPKLTTAVKDMGQYDVIFIGSPNWCSTIAPPVLSFLSAYDFSGKTIVLFVTHGGGGMANCETDFRKACPKANILKGKGFSGSSVRKADSELKKFVNDRIIIKQ